MTGMPRQGTIEQMVANALTNGALAHRLDMVRGNRRAFDRATTDALLSEAAMRLRWDDNYENHKEP